jgi:hypothetical protein
MAVTNEFRNYSSGIFADKSGVYTYNHYVSVFGWGETGNTSNGNGSKYWYVQNSYGPTWG